MRVERRPGCAGRCLGVDHERPASDSVRGGQAVDEGPVVDAAVLAADDQRDPPVRGRPRPRRASAARWSTGCRRRTVTPSTRGRPAAAGSRGRRSPAPPRARALVVVGAGHAAWPARTARAISALRAVVGAEQAEARGPVVGGSRRRPTPTRPAGRAGRRRSRSSGLSPFATVRSRARPGAQRQLVAVVGLDVAAVPGQVVGVQRGDRDDRRGRRRRRPPGSSTPR